MRNLLVGPGLGAKTATTHRQPTDPYWCPPLPFTRRPRPVSEQGWMWPLQLGDLMWFHSQPHSSPFGPSSQLGAFTPAGGALPESAPSRPAGTPVQAAPLRGPGCWSISQEGKGLPCFVPHSLPRPGTEPEMFSKNVLQNTQLQLHAKYNG